MLSFKTLSIDDADRIESFVNRHQPYSDFNFMSLYSWSLHSQIAYAMTSDAIFLSMPDYISQQKIYSFLSYDDPESSLELMLQWMRSNSLQPRFSLLPEFMKDRLESHLRLINVPYRTSDDRDAYDYIISPSKVVDSKGADYSDLRYKMGKFNRLFGDRVKKTGFDPKNPEDAGKAARLANRWAERKKIRNELYEDELYAFNRFLQVAQRSPAMIYTAYEMDGELVGLASVEVVNKDYAVGHFLKSDISLTGIYYKLVHDMCCQLEDMRIPNLNIEQDLGIPGLREAKLRLRPVSFLKKFSLEIEG